MKNYYSFFYLFPTRFFYMWVAFWLRNFVWERLPRPVWLYFDSDSSFRNLFFSLLSRLISDFYVLFPLKFVWKLFQRGSIHFVLFAICVGGLFILDLLWKWLPRARWLLFDADSIFGECSRFFSYFCRIFYNYFNVEIVCVGWSLILKLVWEQLSRSISTAFRFWLVFLKPVFWLSKKNVFLDFLLVVHCNWYEVFHIGFRVGLK